MVDMGARTAGLVSSCILVMFFVVLVTTSAAGGARHKAIRCTFHVTLNGEEHGKVKSTTVRLSRWSLATGVITGVLGAVISGIGVAAFLYSRRAFVQLFLLGLSCVAPLVLLTLLFYTGEIANLHGRMMEQEGLMFGFRMMIGQQGTLVAVNTSDCEMTTNAAWVATIIFLYLILIAMVVVGGAALLFANQLTGSGLMLFLREAGGRVTSCFEFFYDRFACCDGRASYALASAGGGTFIHVRSSVDQIYTEIELTERTIDHLKERIAQEFSVTPKDILRILKNGRTIVRRDRDVARLDEGDDLVVDFACSTRALYTLEEGMTDAELREVERDVVVNAVEAEEVTEEEDTIEKKKDEDEEDEKNSAKVEEVKVEEEIVEEVKVEEEIVEEEIVEEEIVEEEEGEEENLKRELEQSIRE